MELTFPFRNICYNSLIEFQEREFQIQYFIEYRIKNDNFYKEIINKSINRYFRTLADFKNEILQVVNTSNQETIDQYFKELQEIVNWIKEKDKSIIFAEIVEYNRGVLRNFEEKVEERTKEYFDKEERTKYKHLEEYETYELPLLFPYLNQNAQQVKKINYNFYCIEETPDLLDLDFFDDYFDLVEKFNNEFFTIAEKFINDYKAGEIKVNEEKFYSKVIVYVEGEHDIKLIEKAAELLGKEIIFEKIVIRQRGGFRNLDKIWNFYKNNSIEIIPQIKILLYDCDTNKDNDDFGYMHKRVIPTFKGHLVTKGIENLFSTATIQRAISYKKEFVDFLTKKGIERGKEFFIEENEINKDEKANFCTWICDNGTNEDFESFTVIFTILSEILNNR